ncbi:MAG: hypothetical protein IT198_14125 [Acidimicrobiia bacterium]|nr:hypothetical protein [Acidimicrobiia bacterium]
MDRVGPSLEDSVALGGNGSRGVGGGLELQDASQRVSLPPRARAPRRFWLSRKWWGVLCIGALAFALNWAALRAMDRTQQIAIARGDLAGGSTVGLDAFDFADVRLPDATLDRFLTPRDLADRDGWVLSRPLDSGEPVSRSAVVPPATAEGLREMSVPIDPAFAAAGSLRPGDRVDVIEVRDGVASLIMANAEVLDVGDTEDGGIVGSTTAYAVTLAVPDEQRMLRLGAANAEQGGVQLVKATGAAPADETATYDTEAPQGGGN